MPEGPQSTGSKPSHRCSGGEDAARTLSLPVLTDQPDAKPVDHPRIRRSRAGKWRAGVLIGVQALMAAHIAHWAIAGRTVSPVEPSEAMYALELGQLNAGFIFFALALLATFVFGRFFCGWGCHIVALQDFCGWAMTKLGVRPKPFRSRLLVWVPLIVALYMFVWPTLKREALAPALDAWWPRGLVHLGMAAPFPGFTDHLMTEQFWKTFPPVWVAIPFLLVCGFATVYFLGAKGFCTYGCPYGGFFAPAQQVAPGRILVDLDRCERCGHCTAVCTSNVRVHEEIQVYGGVVDPGCMKCMDCVSVCPNDALHFGFAKPPAFASRRAEPPKRKPDMSWPEEVGVALVFVFTFFGTRGVYSAVPMLFALGIAGCAAFIAFKCWRMTRERDVRIVGAQLRRKGRVTPGGATFLTGAALLFAFIAHCFTINTLRWIGGWHDGQVMATREAVFSGDPLAIDEPTREHARAAEALLARAGSFRLGGIGLADTKGDRIRIAWLQMVLGRPKDAEESLRIGLRQSGPVDGLHADLLQNLVLQGRRPDAIAHARQTLARTPDLPILRDTLVQMLLQDGLPVEAIAVYRDRLDGRPGDVHARTRLAQLLFSVGRTQEGGAELTRAARDLRPEDHMTRRQVAEMLAQLGRMDEALGVFTAAIDAAPKDAAIRAGLGGFYLALGRAEDAARELEEAVRRRPRIPAMRADYALALFYSGKVDEAVGQLERAASQDPAGRVGYWRMAGRMLTEAGRGAEGSQWTLRAEQRERRLRGG